MYEEVADHSNPFNISGISKEDHALIQYLIYAKKVTGIDVVVTSTTDHPAGPTRHLQTGTQGLGLAIDCRLRIRKLDSHIAVFNIFHPVEDLLYELIYAGAPYNIKAGKRVAPYAVAGHHDHVHVAVNRGTFLMYRKINTPTTPLGDDVAFTDKDSTNLEAMKNYLVDQQKQNARIIELLEAIALKA